MCQSLGYKSRQPRSEAAHCLHHYPIPDFATLPRIKAGCDIESQTVT